MRKTTSSYQRANQAKAFFMVGAVFFSLSILLLTYLVGTPYGRLAAAQKRLSELQKTQEARGQQSPVAPTWQVSQEEIPNEPDKESTLATEQEPDPATESVPLPESEKDTVLNPDQS